jgi:hypothetical protein
MAEMDFEIVVHKAIDEDLAREVDRDVIADELQGMGIGLPFPEIVAL